MVLLQDIRVAYAKRIHKSKPDQDLKSSANNGLKSAMVVSKTHPVKETYIPRTSSSQRYAELPSIRYGATPNVTAAQMIGSGPLRVSVHYEGENTPPRRSSLMRYTRSYSSYEVQDDAANSTEFIRDEAPPAAVRRVRFADLPPKTSSCESEEVGRRNRIGIPPTDITRLSTKQTPRIKPPPQSRVTPFVTESFVIVKSPTTIIETNYPLTRSYSSPYNSLDNIKNSVHVKTSNLKHSANIASSRIHDTGRYRRGTLPPTIGSSPTHTPVLPPLLRAAKDGDDNEVTEILRKCVLTGVPAEELNAADNSGRTALSYIAANGTLSNLEAILKVPGIDVNKQDNEGNTPLHFAAQAGQVEIVNYLLSRCTGLDVDARNALGFTPLMKAALQGRTKCAKLLLFAGASPVLRDTGRGLRAEQWARYCGRYVCAEVIEKFSRHRLLDRNMTHGRWGSEPELAARIISSKVHPTSNTPTSSSSIKSKIRKAFRTTSHPGPDPPPKPPFSIVTQLTSAALCASSPVLPSSQNVQQSIKSLIRPLTVPKVQVTLATSYSSSSNTDDSPDSPPSQEPVLKERPPTSRPNAGRKKKK